MTYFSANPKNQVFACELGKKHGLPVRIRQNPPRRLSHGIVIIDWDSVAEFHRKSIADYLTLNLARLVVIHSSNETARHRFKNQGFLVFSTLGDEMFLSLRISLAA